MQRDPRPALRHWPGPSSTPHTRGVWGSQTTSPLGLLGPSTPPRPAGWRPGELACPAPSLQPHYRTFNANTSRSAPAPRGTLPQTVSAAQGSPSHGQRATSPMSWPSVSRHRFSSSTPAPTTSSRHLNTEHHQSDTQAALWLHHTQSVALSRGYAPTPVAMLSLFYDASAVVQPCSSFRRIPDPLLASRFRDRFPPRHLTGMTPRRFGLPACTASPEDLPPSLAQHGSQKRPSTSLPFSFEDTRADRRCTGTARSPRPAGCRHRCA